MFRIIEVNKDDSLHESSEVIIAPIFLHFQFEFLNFLIDLLGSSDEILLL